MLWFPAPCSDWKTGKRVQGCPTSRILLPHTQQGKPSMAVLPILRPVHCVLRTLSFLAWTLPETTRTEVIPLLNEVHLYFFHTAWTSCFISHIYSHLGLVQPISIAITMVHCSTGLHSMYFDITLWPIPWCPVGCPLDHVHFWQSVTSLFKWSSLALLWKHADLFLERC